MKTVSLLIVIVALFSCKAKKNSEAENTMNTGNAIAILASDKEMNEIDSAPFEIQKCSIEGNTLLLSVEYSGGCQDHDFQLIGSQFISKSLPPIRAVKLLHNSNGDACRGIIKKDLSFDISALAYIQDVGSVIYLTLEGWEERLVYTYVAEKK